MISFRDFILNANYENEWVKLCFVTDAKEDLRQQEHWKGSKHFTRFPDAKDLSEIKAYLNNRIVVDGNHERADDAAIVAAKLVWNDYVKARDAQ